MSFEPLLEWCSSNGAQLSSNIHIKEIANGNIGMVYDTESDSPPHIELPVKLAITADTAKKSLGDLKVPRNSLLKLFLCKSRITTCFHTPYIKLLPNLFQINSPYCWAPEYKKLLKGSNLGNSLSSNLNQIVEEWFTAVGALPEDQKPENHFLNMKFYYEYKFYTDEDMYKYLQEGTEDNWTGFAAYLWAACIVKSRAFPTYLVKENLDYEVEQDESMLLPLIDLLNHDPKSKVSWIVENGSFNFACENPGKELFNNYGMKGNEELLLGYGFCLENNSADSAALKIKIPEEMVSSLEKWGIELPKLEDYTMSVVSAESTSKDVGTTNSTGDLLFFITSTNIPQNLIQVFQYLVKNKWESKTTLRMQLAGLNHLRQAIEQKSQLLNEPSKSEDVTTENIRIYIHSQKQIFSAVVKTLKRMEKELLANHKKELVTLKNVYKKDIQFQQGLLIGFGVMSYESIVENQLSDQCWLLFLLRCYNREHFPEDSFLPEWIHDLFVRVRKQEITPEEVLQYKEIYLGLIPPLAESAPAVFGQGNWTVEDLITSARLLDMISFVRGKEQECILVNAEY